MASSVSQLLVLAGLVSKVFSSLDAEDEGESDLPWVQASDGNDYAMKSLRYPGWKDNMVPVLYDKRTMRPDEIAVIKSVHDEMTHLIKCVKFAPIDELQDKKPKKVLLITKEPGGNGKSASVSYSKNKNMLMKIKFHNITNTPYNRLVLTHESLHALGLGHTIKRHDRDKYVELLEENITPDKRGQYEKCDRCEVFDDIPYDCASIMHYRRCRYGMEPCHHPKFQAKDPDKCNIVDMNFNMSETDIKLARTINCKKKKNDGVSRSRRHKLRSKIRLRQQQKLQKQRRLKSSIKKKLKLMQILQMLKG